MTAPFLPAPPLGEERSASWSQPPPVVRPSPAVCDLPLEEHPAVAQGLATSAARFGLRTVGDVLAHLPARYEDYEQAVPIAQLIPGREQTARARLQSIRVQRTRRRGLRLIRARLRDDTGLLEAVWFNQDYLVRTLNEGDELMLRGKVDKGSPTKMTVKAHEVVASGGGIHTQGLVPVYPGGEALPPRRVRELAAEVAAAAGGAVETLPTWIRGRLGLPAIADALGALHRPRHRGDVSSGRRRLAFEELLVLQLSLMVLQREEAERRSAPRLMGDGALRELVRMSLPFTLTAGQEKAVTDISRDLARPRPMRRLLQGEVGSGKTIVATLAVCQAAECDRQSAILVPTEVLAQQHIRTLDELLEPTGHRPVLLTGSVGAAERERRLMDLKTGTAMVAVGTQALLSQGVEFPRLGLVIVDEQHRFGVAQRQLLAEQVAALGGEGEAAHLLYMTATPIPRTLALTAFGDLQVSAIHGRPPGRRVVETQWVREDDRDDAYEFARAQVREGRQVFVICPRVDETDDEEEGKSAVAEAKRLAAGPFAGLSVGLAHGSLRGDDKRGAMEDFASGDTDVLVATTVVEVGIDVPNATVMIIENADRFGLAQLHQLRGRVGRGEHPGVCMVFGEPATEEGERRLEALAQNSDGFRLAELDLDIRGEGSILGRRQAGATDLHFARLGRDRRALAQARQIARRVLREDADLDLPEHRLLRGAVDARFADLTRAIEA